MKSKSVIVIAIVFVSVLIIGTLIFWLFLWSNQNTQETEKLELIHTEEPEVIEKKQDLTESEYVHLEVDDVVVFNEPTSTSTSTSTTTDEVGNVPLTPQEEGEKFDELNTVETFDEPDDQSLIIEDVD